MRKGYRCGVRTRRFEKEMQNTKPSIFYSFSAFQGWRGPRGEVSSGWLQTLPGRVVGPGEKMIWIDAKLKGCCIDGDNSRYNVCRNRIYMKKGCRPGCKKRGAVVSRGPQTRNTSCGNSGNDGVALCACVARRATAHVTCCAVTSSLWVNVSWCPLTIFPPSQVVKECLWE